MGTERRSYRVDVRTREKLYRRALESIPFQLLPKDDPQRLPVGHNRGDPVYFKTVETPLEDTRARAVWFCSYMAAGAYPEGSSFEETVLQDQYECCTDRRWVGTYANGKVVATARSLKADEVGHFQIHSESAGFGPLALPPNSIYGERLPESTEEIEATREVSAFAVDLEGRTWQRDVLVGLIKVILNSFQETGVRYAYSSIDESFFHLVNYMGLRLEQVGRRSLYMGSIVVPSFFQVQAMIDNLLPEHQALHAFMVGGDEFPPGSRYAFYRRVRSRQTAANGGGR
ncbi:MAG: hypothetical protein ACUVX1_08000 [Chloroflexota bacterium]